LVGVNDSNVLGFSTINQVIYPEPSDTEQNFQSKTYQGDFSVSQLTLVLSGPPGEYLLEESEDLTMWQPTYFGTFSARRRSLLYTYPATGARFFKVDNWQRGSVPTAGL
jgi:hypothetical protein